MPGLPVHHRLPEVTQTYVHRVGDAIQHEAFAVPLTGSEDTQASSNSVVGSPKVVLGPAHGSCTAEAWLGEF